MANQSFDRRQFGAPESDPRQKPLLTPFRQYRDRLLQMSSKECDAHLRELEREIDQWHAIAKITLYERLLLKGLLRERAWPVFQKNSQRQEPA